MDPRYDGDGAYGRYEDDNRCPVCFVPPSAPHLESCDYEGIWDGDGDDRESDTSTGHWSG